MRHWLPLVFVVCLAGCGGGSASRSAPDPVAPLGIWKLVDLEDSSGSTACPGSSPQGRACAQNEIWRVNADGTLVIKQENRPPSTNYYSISGNVLTLKSDPLAVHGIDFVFNFTEERLDMTRQVPPSDFIHYGLARQ